MAKASIIVFTAVLLSLNRKTHVYKQSHRSLLHKMGMHVSSCQRSNSFVHGSQLLSSENVNLVRNFLRAHWPSKRSYPNLAYRLPP